MFDTILGIIRGTPAWVWLLFGYLIYRGIVGLQSRIMPLKNLFTMPIIFLGLSLQNIVSRMCSCFNVPVLAVYLASLLGGMGIGWLIVHNIKITAADEKTASGCHARQCFYARAHDTHFWREILFWLYESSKPSSHEYSFCRNFICGCIGALCWHCNWPHVALPLSVQKHRAY